MQVRSDQAIFIGNDRYRDIFGARQLGMKTILFAPNQGIEQSNGAEPDYIIYQFVEMLQALDFLAAR